MIWYTGNTQIKKANGETETSAEKLRQAVTTTDDLQRISNAGLEDISKMDQSEIAYYADMIEKTYNNQYQKGGTFTPKADKVEALNNILYKGKGIVLF